MATRTIPAFSPRSVAKGAARIAYSRPTQLMYEQPSEVKKAWAKNAPMTVAPELLPPMPDENLGAMRGFAFVLLLYLLLAAAAIGALSVWRFLL